MGDMRRIPGPFAQFRIISERRLAQIFRGMWRRAIDTGIICTTALILGLQHNSNPNSASNIIIFHLALALLVSVNCLPCFGSDRTMFWRERSHGLHGAAYCLARMAADSLDVFLQSTLYVT